MTAASTLKFITSRLVPSRLAGKSDAPIQPQAPDQHVQDDHEEYSLPLRPVTFPKILPYHQHALDSQGWTTITYDTPTDKLHETSQALFRASQAFFDLPREYKETFKTEIGSEEGWSRIEGEKEFITLRCFRSTPKELKDAAAVYWAEAGKLLNEILGRIAESLGLPAEALTVYSEPCTKLPVEKTATILRLFRYEGFEGKESKTVAERKSDPFTFFHMLRFALTRMLLAHRDLGLLSLVNGDTPGLEVWDRHAQKYFQIERTYERPAGSLIVGRQLERLSNCRYLAGGHQVRSYPDPPLQPDLETITEKPRRGYRFSIVFVLRAHSPIDVDTDMLTTPITGKFQHPLKGIKAQELFRDIQRSHFNINMQIQEREEQRRHLAKKKKQSASPLPPESQSKKVT